MTGLLTVAEVADYLKTTTTTVYRWIKEGTLTAVKIGKEWRIEESLLDAVLRRGRSAAGSFAHFREQLKKNEHIILITDKNAEIAKFEAAFFKMGLEEGAMLMKGCWWQDEDEVVGQYARFGLDAASLIENGVMTIINFNKLYKNEGVDGPVKAWRSNIDLAISRGAPRLWASGSPSMYCCESDPVKLLNFEAQLNDAIKNLPVIGVCPYSVEDSGNREHFDKMITLMTYHSGVAFYSDDQCRLLRQ